MAIKYTTKWLAFEFSMCQIQSLAKAYTEAANQQKAESQIGIKLKWFTNYLSGHTQGIKYGDSYSNRDPLLGGYTSEQCPKTLTVC